jgi:pilus assembly protein Flp/PilA
MNTIVAVLHFCVRCVVMREEGQDLVEYALVFSMIAFGAISGMGYLATGINTEFSNVATTLTTSIN